MKERKKQAVHGLLFSFDNAVAGIGSGTSFNFFFKKHVPG
jgi:hypothetical protein